MAQLRHNYGELVARGAEVVVVGPEDRRSFKEYWDRNALPFIGLADPSHQVADAFGQEHRLARLGRLPALVVIDRNGEVRFARYGESMRDIVSGDELLAAIDWLNQPSSASAGASVRAPD